MPTIGPNLEYHKAEAVKKVNTAIGDTRLKYITDIPGQESLYGRKLASAKEYLALDPEPTTLDGFYLISKEVGKTALTAYELCQLWLNMNAQWEVIAGDLEDIRVPTNTAIEIATSRAEIDALMQQAMTDIETSGY